MAESIRGLTVEISADASSFNKEMSSMRKAAQSSQSELNALQKSLELEFDPNKLERAQKVAQQAIDQTAANADALRRRLDFLSESGNVNTDAYRKLQTELAKTELKGQQLEKQLEKINATKFTAISGQITKIGDGITGVGRALTPLSAAAGASLAGLGALGKKAISAADDIATLSQQYGMSATALQKLNYIALQTDTQNEDLYKGFVKVRAGVADIASGATSAASTALRSLNIDINSFNGGDEQFYAIIDSLSKMEDKTQMVAIANDIFGDKLANNLLPLIYSGSDAIAEYSAEYENLGALTNEQVDALSGFDNVLNTIKTQLSNVALQIGASLLPIMQKLADIVSNKIVPKLQKMAEWFNTLTIGQQEFIAKALLLVAALAPVLLIIGKLTSGIGSIISILPKLGSALSALAANPIMFTISAIAAILFILYTQCEAFRESINTLVMVLMSALQPVLDIIMSLLQTVMEILSPIIDLLGGIFATVINLVMSALQPFFDILSVLFELLQPLLEVALIPLQLCLTALQVPLQILGKLLGWLAPLFQVFGNIVSKIFGGVVKVINIVLGVIEDAVNFVIGIINCLIDGVNAALGWLGVNINHIADVKLRIDTSEVDDMDDVNAIIDSTPPGTAGSGTVYDGGGTATNGDNYNYDNSTTNKTQNITVTIQNYAAEVDTDKLVKEINIKLAEAL